MSEPPPPQSTFDFLTSGSQSQLPTNGAGIEKREELIPVSPAPLHVADASTIPVLKNQMDPGLNTTSLGPFSQDDDSEDENDDREESYDPESAPVQDSFPSHPSSPHTEDAINYPNGLSSGASAPQSSTVHTAQQSSETRTEPQPKPMPNIDLQALLTRLSPTSTQQPAATSKELTSFAASTTPTTSSLPSPPPSLPKPPIPATHPLPAPVHVPAAAVKNPLARSGLPPSLPNPATFQQPKHAVPTSPTGTEEPDDRPFTVEEEEAYERFLEDERDYVTKGQWDRFPIGSRLFIGNLPSEKVTKRDIFRIFSRHGRLAQISIKQAYGFVQFLDVASCTSALRDEQGATCKGRKMHLEVSKPQGKSRDNANRQSNRRSRSPDYRPLSPHSGNSRGGSLPRGGSHYNGDRSYRPSRDGRDHRDRDRDRDRDDFDRRSPPARYPRARDDYRPGRDRSRSPLIRYRSRTPEDVPLPRRAPGDVPEVQVIVTDEVDRNFLWFVEKAFRDRMVRVDTLFLAPRLDIGAVVRRQILEGVQAVVFLDRKMQVDGKINMQVFDRRGGEANVRFDEYSALDPQVACELVIRARQTHGAPTPQQPQYGYGYGAASAVPTLSPQTTNATAALLAQALAAQQPGGNANLVSLISSLDAPTLQKLLATLQQQQQPQLAPPQAQPYQQPMPPAQSQITPDLAALLSGRPPAPAAQSNGAYGAGLNMASLYGQPPAQQQQQQQPAQQQQPQLQNILETLGRYKH
ncbi:hypothetical protein BDZ91DRAFT_837438 [Kalaharituber pfeilii]|nr:hypothetical protein BDZ91DRAFT_837438 [Kalaharituber pfeilii]